MWIIHDVQLIDPNAVEYFTELDSMQCKEGDERVMAKKQDAFKHLHHEHLILELVYFDRSNMIMYFGWCNHKEEFEKVSHNMHGILSCAYQRYWLRIKTKWGKICIPVYLLVLRQGIAPMHPQRDGAGSIYFGNGNYHGSYTLDGTLWLTKKHKNTAASLSDTLPGKNKRKRSCSVSFDTRIHELKVYKAANGHCNVPQTGKDTALGQWCNELRVSHKKIQNNQTFRTKLSDEEIQCLNDLDFTWNRYASFEMRIHELKVYKAANGHCNVPTTDKDAYLGRWCSQMRGSYKKMKLSDEEIHCLNDLDFTWNHYASFEMRIHELKVYKAANDHYNVPTTGKDASLGRWCREKRRLYKKKELSDEAIQCLNDLDFTWIKSSLGM
jgi:hypothetical protein